MASPLSRDTSNSVDEIHLRKLDRNSTDKFTKDIFRQQDNYTSFVSNLENAVQFNGYNLFLKYKPKFQLRNKLLLYDAVTGSRHNYQPSKDGKILMTRWLEFQLPEMYEKNTKTQHRYESNVFQYESEKNTNDNEIDVEWYLNFAHNDLFLYYGSSLLAQDELQVLECLQLASIREFLVADPSHFSSYTIENGQPRPILISNVERVINLDTENIYGNRFAHAPQDVLFKSYKYLKPPLITNIIAIEAPSGGQGHYDLSTIRYVISECYTAFKAAKLLAIKTYELNSKESFDETKTVKTIIHTGWFGCGAYGGNHSLMLILQLIGAQLADVDKIVFHTVSRGFDNEIAKADEYMTKLFEGNDKDKMTVDDLINKIFKEKFEWGESNGT
ncbi:unnamed protein product [Didymodactylos carnosus]|uniref:PARG catalytic Macro domain-containing protein n=1 Tax=Didymodactylos carnosus TaxID=1234261 RepID=A0A813RMV2_9BILA|nr:unnamed protein product [Didymodactylos carnosus]CAF3568394.1 unnamed protein product [Didymodactylos carnosus]